MTVAVDDVFAAIATAWNASATLTSSFAGRLYQNQAPENPAFPYVIFESITHERVYRTSHTETWLSQWYFRVYGSGTFEQTTALAKTIEGVFDPLTLNIAGGRQTLLQHIMEDPGKPSGDWKLNRADSKWELRWNKPRGDQ